jgi:hypothetical protein
MNNKELANAWKLYREFSEFLDYSESRINYFKKKMVKIREDLVKYRSGMNE